MSDDIKIWKTLDDAAARRQKQTSIDELTDEADQLYCQCHYGQAAALFSQAVSLAEKKGDLSAQCENLFWEGACYTQDHLLKKALICFMKAEQLKGLDAVTQFCNLNALCTTAMELRLPEADIKFFLNQLSPYKDALQFGGSKSMVLRAECRFFILCGKFTEALAKAQEAVASRVDEEPMYDDCVYFQDLVTAYYINGQIPEAWAALRRWRIEGSSEYAIVKHEQLKAELTLFISEYKLDDAWDVLQRLKAEEQYLSRTGMHFETLDYEVLIGTKTGRFEQAKSALSVFFYKYRNSDDPSGRYFCYKAFARYYCAYCHLVPQENRERTKRHAEFCLVKAEQMAERLDNLIQAAFWTKDIQYVREEFEEL